jgi:hypothetical protein
LHAEQQDGGKGEGAGGRGGGGGKGRRKTNKMNLWLVSVDSELREPPDELGGPPAVEQRRRPGDERRRGRPKGLGRPWGRELPQPGPLLRLRGAHRLPRTRPGSPPAPSLWPRRLAGILRPGRHSARAQVPAAALQELPAR